jgi:hypothetical protein
MEDWKGLTAWLLLLFFCLDKIILSLLYFSKSLMLCISDRL